MNSQELSEISNYISDKISDMLMFYLQGERQKALSNNRAHNVQSICK